MKGAQGHLIGLGIHGLLAFFLLLSSPPTDEMEWNKCEDVIITQMAKEINF